MSRKNTHQPIVVDLRRGAERDSDPAELSRRSTMLAVPQSEKTGFVKGALFASGLAAILGVGVPVGIGACQSKTAQAQSNETTKVAPTQSTTTKSAEKIEKKNEAYMDPEWEPMQNKVIYRGKAVEIAPKEKGVIVEVITKQPEHIKVTGLKPLATIDFHQSKKTGEHHVLYYFSRQLKGENSDWVLNEPGAVSSVTYQVNNQVLSQYSVLTPFVTQEERDEMTSHYQKVVKNEGVESVQALIKKRLDLAGTMFIIPIFDNEPKNGERFMRAAFVSEFNQY